MSFQLVSRGYDFNKIRKVSHSISIIDRKSLIPYKTKNNSISNNFIFFKLPFDRNFINIFEIIHSSFTSLKNKYSFLNNFKINTLFQMQPNISSMLIHKIFSFNFNNIFKSYKNCNNINCKICKYSNKHKFIKLNNFFLPILTNGSCNSTKIIYIINCNKCNYYYIGETMRCASKRISEHLNDIIYFKPYIKRNTPVSINLKDHSLSNFSFFILDENLDDLLRFNIEAQIIRLFSYLNCKLINESYPSIYNNIFKINI